MQAAAELSYVHIFLCGYLLDKNQIQTNPPSNAEVAGTLYFYGLKFHCSEYTVSDTSQVRNSFGKSGNFRLFHKMTLFTDAHHNYVLECVDFELVS